MKHRLFLKLIALVCLLALFLCGCSSENVEPITSILDDFSCYDEQGLIDASDVIVVGTVIKTEIIYTYNGEDYEDERLKKGRPNQFSHIEVTRTLQGSVPENDKIVVPLAGDGKTYSVDNFKTIGGYFEKGDRVLLFLKNVDDEYWVNLKEYHPKYYRKTKKYKDSQRTISNLSQSIFWLDEEGNMLHDLNKSNIALFTDCATVDELVEKYGLN